MTAAALLMTAAIGASCAPALPGRPVPVEMTDFAFAPRDLVLRPGEVVTLVLKNKGAVPHELMVGRGAIQHSGGYAEDLLGGVELRTSGLMKPDHTHGGSVILVDKGMTAQVTFTVPARPGVYEMGCFEPGHYAAGMLGRLTVTAP